MVSKSTITSKTSKTSKTSRSPVKESDFVLFQDTIIQPLDHFADNGESLEQRIFVFIPKNILSNQRIQTNGLSLSSLFTEEGSFFAPIPVFFVLGNESAVDPTLFLQRIMNYGSTDVIFITTEHRGYGSSISTNPDQSLPRYVSIKQVMQDYHQVVSRYKSNFTGPWIGAGYSYGGGLVINFGHDFPEDVEIILSSSGVVDWSFLMDTYDKQVRLNLGPSLYGQLVEHVSNLMPETPFDQNWIDREMILAFITGFSQMDTFNSLLPLFRLLSKLPTSQFVKILKWMDRKFAEDGALHYALSNAKRQISSEEVKSGKFSWRVWRFQQFYETGVFWQSAGHKGVYQRTVEDLSEECKILFGETPPLLDKPRWNPLSMVSNLKIPLIFVCGGKDPWKGVCLSPQDKIPSGKYFYFAQSKHCPDITNPNLGKIVMDDILGYLNYPNDPKSSAKASFFNQNSFYSTEESKYMLPITEFSDRLHRLQAKIKEEGLDAFIVSDSGSIYYYTGASYKAQERPFFIIVRSESPPTFLVPKLEESHMEKANIGLVESYWEYPAPKGKGWPERMEDVLKGMNSMKKLGLEPSISLENRNKIIALSSLQASSVEPYEIVEKLRLVKSEAEIAMIREASRYADMGMTMMLKNAYYGVSVLEMFSIAKKIQLEVIKTGFFDPLQTEFLTATWPAPFSAKPHGVPPVDGKLKDGPLAAMSYLRVNGYAAECERTFCLAPPTEKHQKMFTVMQEARNRAFAMIRPGIKASDVDKAAMDYLKEAGYGDFLLHRTGHGIGQGNHEGPWVAEGSDHILEENMVISVEPGIYVAEFGGVRHADTVL
ncbi:MAG: M24 family metallopeptidase, partial [Promethearchaeota archaeon]